MELLYRRHISLPASTWVYLGWTLVRVDLWVMTSVWFLLDSVYAANLLISSAESLLSTCLSAGLCWTPPATHFSIFLLTLGFLPSHLFCKYGLMKPLPLCPCLLCCSGVCLIFGNPDSWTSCAVRKSPSQANSEMFSVTEAEGAAVKVCRASQRGNPASADVHEFFIQSVTADNFYPKH